MSPRRASALALALCLAGAPVAAQTLGPVDLAAGVGASFQHDPKFTPVGPHLWLGAETVLERRLRVRLDAGLHYFPYRGQMSISCPASTFCPRPITADLRLVAVTGAVIWRDTTGTNPWYALAGLGAFSDANGRDANSRVGLVGGLGVSFGHRDAWFLEARVNLPYDAYGYGAVVPVTIGRRFARFTP